MESKKCEICGKEFRRIPSGLRKARFCSLICLSKFANSEQSRKRKEKWQTCSRDEYVHELRERLNKFVTKTEGCWSWNGGKDTCEYGKVRFRKKNFMAHRASYIAYIGEIPKGLYVLHKCDNPECTNPEHLFLGSQKDNMRDCAAKGRTKCRNKLQPDQIPEIRKLINLGVNMAKIGRDYNVSRTAIVYIKYGKCWKNIK